jgi:hypothetical protein
VQWAEESRCPQLDSQSITSSIPSPSSSCHFGTDQSWLFRLQIGFLSIGNEFQFMFAFTFLALSTTDRQVDFVQIKTHFVGKAIMKPEILYQHTQTN